MQGTRTRSRTHTTPPLQRRSRVAPAGRSHFRTLFLFRTVGRVAQSGLSDFRAGGQRGPHSQQGVVSP